MTDLPWERAEGATNPLGEWLVGTGPDSDVAVCTRVRFARNVDGYRFTPSMSADEARELNATLCAWLRSDAVDPRLEVFDLDALDELDRQLLLERHLISRELVQSERARSVAIDAGESVSIMVNEEDHIRAQLFRSGQQIDDAYRAAERLDEALIRHVPLAFSEEFGFLTSCPTNTGTGLRVSVMLHLPGMVWSEEIDKATTAAPKIHLAVRGLFGEGSRAVGDFYQVSNQVTLGKSEAQILDDVRAAVDHLVGVERKVRGALTEGDGSARTLDRVFRALGTLQSARVLSSDECLTALSAVRFGVQAGLVDGVSLSELNEILLLTQPGHLQRRHGRRLEPQDRDRLRANLVRDKLAGARSA